jgi:hypothetical protein
MNYTSKIAAWLEKHPVVGLPVHVISFLYHYITSFKWVIDIVRWMVTTAGNIAESAFLLATVYVTTNTVAHLLVTWILPAQMIVTLNQISTMAFSVLPELIIAQALKITFDHWKVVWRSPKRVDAWIWACSYTIPTLVFLIMTILTISTFVNFEAVNATPPQATGPMLVIRCLAGWSYGMVQILFVSIGKQGYIDILDELHAQIHTRDEALAESKEMLSTLQQDIATLQEQMAQQESALFDAQMALATRRMTRIPSQIHISKRGKEETKQRSAVHLLKKDESHIESRSTLSHDVSKDLESDVNREQEGMSAGSKSALNEDLLSDASSKPRTISTGSNTSLNEDVQSDVNEDLDRDQIGISSENKTTLDKDMQSDVNRELNKDQAENKRAHKSDLLSDVNREQEGMSAGSKSALKTKSDSSEAAKKIQRILRKNPNTGPTELAAKTGVSRRYASQVKSQFLTKLAAEQSA